MDLTGNKGEWSEVYALLRLLADGRLYPGDASLNRINDIVYPIVKIIREQKSSRVSYELNTEGQSILITSEDGVSIELPTLDFERYATFLYSRIKELKSAQAIPEISGFLRTISCDGLKANSSSKADIRIVIHDNRTGLQPNLGFSIKSQLGSQATLFNASGSTNFIFKLSTPIDDLDTRIINDIDDRRGKVQRRISALTERGISLAYEGVSNNCFEANLRLIDSFMPQILGYLLLYYCTGRGRKISELVDILEEEDPLHYCSSSHRFYEYKIKKLLVEIALGLQPSTPWSGYYDATGGYIVVKENGEVICYHFYDRNLFEDYLYHHTLLDTPSTTRHGFGSVVEGTHFKLNLQIRFS